MKIVELFGCDGVNIAITNEETDVLNKFRDKNEIYRKDLNEREVVIANNLVIKNLLHRKNDNGKILYKKKKIKE